MPVSNSGVRFRLISRERVRCGKACGNGFEPVERHLLRQAQIGTVELPSTLAVGTPVPAPALVPRLLAARREGPHLTAEGESRGGTQPRIPGGPAPGEPTRSSLPFVGQGLFLYLKHSLLLLALVHLPTISRPPVPDR